MSHLGEVLAPLGALAHATLRIWQLEDDHWVLMAGPAAAAPRAPRSGAEEAAWLALPGMVATFLEVTPETGANAEQIGVRVMAVVRIILEMETAAVGITTELTSRYEEIELLYTIGELLGRAHPMAEVAQVILREVTDVVGARRAGLRVYHEPTGTLRSVALIGTEPGTIPYEVPVDDHSIVVVRAFHSQQIETGQQLNWVPGEVLVVPITYAAAGGASRVVGTLALADRAGGGVFTRDEARLVSAVATQIGAALENARLSTLERERERLDSELRLAHNLQLRLMPTPHALAGDAEVAASVVAAESLGGDFYTFRRLGEGRVGVMLGDVSSHGFAAALIAAQVIAMAGVHVNAATQPAETLAALRDTLGEELTANEMYLTLFYGVLDPKSARLVYTNAGHPHAFRVPMAGPAQRLGATALPLGLLDEGSFGAEDIPWGFGSDLLVLFTDGFVDQPDAAGERFGEERMLWLLETFRHLNPEALKETVLDTIRTWGSPPVDDRTLVILRM